MSSDETPIVSHNAAGYPTYAEAYELKGKKVLYTLVEVCAETIKDTDVQSLQTCLLRLCLFLSVSYEEG